MTKKTPIKVIKRDERNRQEKAAEEAKTKKETARDVVATVTEWVNEFQQKRRMETTQAFKSLFSKTTPQPSEA